MHPRTEAALASARELMYAVDEMNDQIDRIRARRPSSTSRVIPEVDAMGRLTDLFIAPGTVAAARNARELVAEIMGAIDESTRDAERQARHILAQNTFGRQIDVSADLRHEVDRDRTER